MQTEKFVIDLDAYEFNAVDVVGLPLINRFYTECNYHVKCGRLDRVFSLKSGGNIVAAARLIPHSSECFLLRNLCVSPEKRNQGLASYLVKNSVARLYPANCYCYSLPHLQHFYRSLGFIHLNPIDVPNDIAEIHLRNTCRKRGWILMGYVNDLINSSDEQN